MLAERIGSMKFTKWLAALMAFVAMAGVTNMAGAQQGSSAAFELGSIATPRTINPAANSTTPSSLQGQQQNPFLGSVARSGEREPTRPCVGRCD